MASHRVCSSRRFRAAAGPDRRVTRSVLSWEVRASCRTGPSRLTRAQLPRISGHSFGPAPTSVMPSCLQPPRHTRRLANALQRRRYFTRSGWGELIRSERKTFPSSSATACPKGNPGTTPRGEFTPPLCDAASQAMPILRPRDGVSWPRRTLSACCACRSARSQRRCGAATCLGSFAWRGVRPVREMQERGAAPTSEAGA